MTLPNNKVYASHAAAVASSTFASDRTPYTPLEFTDYAVGAGSDTSSFTVPASSPYTWRIPAPISKDGFAVTVGGNARTVVETTPASGQVQLDRLSGKLTFHSTDAAGAAIVTMVPLYTVINNNELAMIQSQIVAAQTVIAASLPTRTTTTGISLATAANTTIRTATADEEITRIVILTTAASGSSTPSIAIGVGGSPTFVLALDYPELATNGGRTVILPTGSIPILTTGQALQLQVTSASTGTLTATAKVDTRPA